MWECVERQRKDISIGVQNNKRELPYDTQILDINCNLC